MNKNMIQKYAIWARRELISRVTQKAYQYGVREDGIDAESASIDGRLLSVAEQSERRALVEQVKNKGFEQVMEEVAYTWFNRFCALRFMEVNGYLPVRVFTDENNDFWPQIMTEAIHLEMENLDKSKVYALVEADQKDELFKYLLITQCNALSKPLPGMFQKIDHYTELLFPDNLLREGSAVEQMVSMIPEEDWKDAIQIIGWLYQYYNSEPKDKVFADLKKNIKITKNTIPAATQLFTPDWIVRYMVENSLGRLWLEGHPNAELRSEWKYYLDEAEQTSEVQAQLEAIRAEYRKLEPQDIKVIDPCMGSGHILAYMFDVLMQIYLDFGYNKRVAVRSILENNLYGLDIDDRAGQLAYFAVMMKAQSYDRSFLRREDNPAPHVFSIQESNRINRRHLDFLGGGMDELSRNNAKTQMTGLLDTLMDAKEYGSILKVEDHDWALLRQFAADATSDEAQFSLETTGIDATSANLLHLIDIGETMAQKYDDVVTNPPYMGSGGMGTKLSYHVKREYPDSKSDLFAVFIERCSQMAKNHGYQAMITQQAWMFTAIYSDLRLKLESSNITSLLQLGARAFDEISGEVVQTTTFVIRNSFIPAYKSTYHDLTDGADEAGKELAFLSRGHQFYAVYSDFKNVPNCAMSYWLSREATKDFGMEKFSPTFTTREGMTTANNDLFLRNWHEVRFGGIGLGIKNEMESDNSGYKWFPYNKGGANRKWYGNNDLVVNWEHSGSEIRNIKDPKTGRIRSHNYNAEYSFRESGTWTAICSGDIMVRYSPVGALFDSKGASFFANSQQSLYYGLGMLNTKVSGVFLKVLSPAYEYKVGHVANVPLITAEKGRVVALVEQCIDISKRDWDSFETSWDFLCHPLVIAADVPTVDGGRKATVAEAFSKWEQLCEARFNQLKANEEELNRIFIDIYGLQDELTPEVEDKDVTVRKADLGRDIRSLISYAVGCMFGRYSLDEPGLAYAGGDFDSVFKKGNIYLADENGNRITFGGDRLVVGTGYTQINIDGNWVDTTFNPDTDNILPICDDKYFNDDIAVRFEQWVKTVYGADTLEENLQFIADALGGKGTARDVIRSYFLNDFYAEHLKVYQKRPIYWLFDSGKKNGFKALIYMHRYNQDSLARLRADYVHEQQERYRTAISQTEHALVSAEGSNRVRLNKQLSKLQAQLDEASVFEEKVAHLADQRISIDLDDGVKHNYALFQNVLAKIK